MGILDSALKGKEIGRRKVLVYGEAGVGKTTFACGAPSPIVIQTEEGANHVGADRLPLCQSYKDFSDQLTGIISEPHDYQTLVIDSLDWLEPMIVAEVCAENKIDALADLPMGKGYALLAQKWLRVCNALSLASAKRGMHIVMVAHAQVRPVYEPGGGDGYDRFSPKLSKKGNAIVCEFATEIMLARIHGETRKEQQAFGMKAVPFGQVDRRLWCQPLRWLVAKNRLGLPEHIPLSWEAFEQYLNPQGEKPNG